LCNTAYILQQYTEKERYYCINGMEIEKQIVYPAISMKSFNQRQKDTSKNPLILFPYKVKAGNVAHYDRDEFEKQYPLATIYLKSYESELNERKKDEKALWFEYGRSQAIGKVFGKKLVMSMVVTKSVSICEAAENVIPYAGYFVKCKNNTTMTLEDAKKILQSRDFLEYVKAYGTPTTPTSYRISANDIKEYKF
ncbi:SAM-dependent methyltransferase, partial [bacterium]|nr:SAM-dependent methyltransferase [bacterium]